MLTPRYFFANDFTKFYDFFLTQPHKKKSWTKNDCLWEVQEPFGKIQYIIRYGLLKRPKEIIRSSH